MALLSAAAPGVALAHGQELGRPIGLAALLALLGAMPIKRAIAGWSTPWRKLARAAWDELLLQALTLALAGGVVIALDTGSWPFLAALLPYVAAVAAVHRLELGASIAWWRALALAVVSPALLVGLFLGIARLGLG